MRLYQMKIEEQKRLRKEVIRQKELRRQEQAGQRKRELLQRLTQQQPQQQLQQEVQQMQHNVQNQPTENSQLCTTHPHPQTKKQLLNRPQQQNVQQVQTVQTLQHPRVNMPPKNIQQRIGLHKQGTPPYYGKQQRVNVTNPSLLASQQELLNQGPKQPLQNPGVILPQDCTQAFGPFSGNPHAPGPAGAAFMESRRPRFSGQVGRLGVLPSPRKVLPSSYVIQNLPRTEGSTGMGAGIPRVAVRPQIPCTLVQQPPEIPIGRGTGGRGTIAGNKRTVLARIGSSELDWGQRILNKVRIVNQAPDVDAANVLGIGVTEQPFQRLTACLTGNAGIQNLGKNPQHHRMVLTGRGRAGASSLGVRGRAVQQSQNLRVVQCKPSRVAIECLSSKTTELQLQNILTSVGPIQNLEISYPQRKAIATFYNPAHAALFQQQYHRHMVDLTHVNVTLVED